MVVGRRESPSQRRLDAERREEIPRAGAGIQKFRKLSAIARHVEAGPAPNGDLLESVGGLLPVVEVARRYDIALLPVLSINRHEAIGLGKRQRPQHHRANDRKQGHAGADAETHDQNGDHGKTRRSAQAAAGMAQIASPRFE